MVKKEKTAQVYKPKLGDKIICEHKGLKYEAKIMNERLNRESQEKTPEKQFFIHYQGWNKNWDEWVDEARIFQYNEANIALMREQRVNHSKSKGVGSIRKKGLLTAAGPSPTSGQAISQQNQSVSSTISSQGSVSDSLILETKDNIQLDKEIKIKIPDEMKNWLIDDDNQVKNKKLSSLPARIPISTILKDFVNFKKTTTKSPSDKEAILNELTFGIKHYFNVMLGAHLLYKFERLQYQNVLKEHGKEADLTTQYGVIHLARLFTKIGRPLAATSLDSQSIQTLVNYIQDLLKFISKQSHLFDLDKNYIVAPPDYIKNALK